MAAWIAAVVLAAALLAPSARAYAAPDARELTAREYFASQRYQEALDLFAKLYAESLHPNYLRNIGRCYQGLGQPDRAIVSFHDYLRKAKVSPEERVEIEGFIKEMEDLKRQQQESAASATAPVTPPLPAVAEAAPPRAADTPPPGTAAAVVTVTPAAPADEAPPVYTRWWFWTLAGAVAVTLALGGAAAAGVFTTTDDASCPTLRRCP